MLNLRNLSNSSVNIQDWRKGDREDKRMRLAKREADDRTILRALIKDAEFDLQDRLKHDQEINQCSQKTTSLL